MSAPAQPVAVPDAVIVLLNHIEDVVDEKNWEKINHNLWNAVTMLAAPAAQGDAKDAERYRYLCSGHGLCDKIENKHLADAAIDLQIAAAIAAKAAS